MNYFRNGILETKVFHIVLFYAEQQCFINKQFYDTDCLISKYMHAMKMAVWY